MIFLENVVDIQICTSSEKIENLPTQALKQFPVILITGPRQSGKSTLLKHALKDCQYVTLDDPLSRQTAAGVEIDLIVEQGGKYDLYEIKYAKTLKTSMAQAMVSFIKEHPVRSAHVLSMQKKSQLLARGIHAQHWIHIFK